jgi:hypothetical protein
MIFVVTVREPDCPPGSRAIGESLRERLVGMAIGFNTNTGPDGTNRQPFGESPTGILILEANGRYAQVFTRPGRPKGAGECRDACSAFDRRPLHLPIPRRPTPTELTRFSMTATA